MTEEIDEAALYEYEMEQERLRNEEDFFTDREANPHDGSMYGDPPNWHLESNDEEDTEIAPVDLEEEVVVEEPRRPEPGTWAGVALDMAMISDDDDDFDWDAWKDEMKESRGAEAYEAYRKRAEMTLREWGESNLKKKSMISEKTLMNLSVNGSMKKFERMETSRSENGRMKKKAKRRNRLKL